MSAANDQRITDKDIVGLRYLDQLGELLQQLHDVGCERDRACNRILHMDQYCMLILLNMFNPVLMSLRGLKQARGLKNVQKRLGCSLASLGSLSESLAVFDSERLKPIMESIVQKLVAIAAYKYEKDIPQTLMLVDGSIVERCLWRRSLPRCSGGQREQNEIGSSHTFRSGLLRSHKDGSDFDSRP